ncbi:NnrS family protein [Sediminicurvatus halobius]|uniref:NnrS family protein n=1 Tax=Sediminicurvatus halobius TaxID=2182432 RepID=A0A2U2MVM7_9GAMM|nr:NnrS family protein [Spiribacter halobius]PWG60908.1 NnrS family protein [Spiribacter halobius]
MGKLTGGSRRHPAYPVFFPVAAAYGAIALPVSVLALHGMAPLPPLATPWGHAQELLFGFGLLVAAGFLLSRERPAVLALLLGLWLLARTATLVAPAGPVAALAGSGFALLVAAVAAPRFLSAAKKLRNQAFAPILIAISLAATAFHAAGASLGTPARYAAVHAGVLLFAVLMLFMAGRIIAPAAAGAARQAGHHLEARVQPRLEAALLLLMAIALVAMLIPGARVAGGTALVLAGAVAAVRLARWRLWWSRHRPDLLCLGAGYAWLAVGLLLWGASALLGVPGRGEAVHAITVGAMGTLTVSVMARIWLVKAGADPAAAPEPVIGTLLLAGAAALRLLQPGSEPALLAAAALWALAYLVLLGLFLRVPHGRRRAARASGEARRRAPGRP